MSAFIEKTLPSTYKPGETIKFRAYGGSDTGETLSPETGFSATTFLEFGNSWGPRGEGIRHTGIYNSKTREWDFTATAPLVPQNDYDYRIFVYITCSNQVLCSKKYLPPLEKDVALKFNVSSN